MKKILQHQREQILELMFKRAISKKWSEKVIAETPEEIKELCEREDLDKKSEEFKVHEKECNEYWSHLDNLEKIEKANEGDLFAYRVLEQCAKEINALIK